MTYVKSGDGREFKWKSDHAFVKVSAEESGGLLSMIEDNLTADFVLPLHKHAEHAETFFIVDGVVEFIIEVGSLRPKRATRFTCPRTRDTLSDAFSPQKC